MFRRRQTSHQFLTSKCLSCGTGCRMQGGEMAHFDYLKYFCWKTVRFVYDLLFVCPFFFCFCFCSLCAQPEPKECASSLTSRMKPPLPQDSLFLFFFFFWHVALWSSEGKYLEHTRKVTAVHNRSREKWQINGRGWGEKNLFLSSYVKFTHCFFGGKRYKVAKIVFVFFGTPYLAEQLKKNSAASSYQPHCTKSSPCD